MILSHLVCTCSLFLLFATENWIFHVDYKVNQESVAMVILKLTHLHYIVF